MRHMPTGTGSNLSFIFALRVKVAREGFEQFDERRKPTADSPHNHVEIAELPAINVTSPFTASGQSEATFYRLHVQAAYSEGQAGKRILVGYEALGVPDNFGWQTMSVRFSTLSELLDALNFKLGLPREQIEAVRLTLLRGEGTEIGGSFSGVIRLFSEQALGTAGLRFGTIHATDRG